MMRNGAKQNQKVTATVTLAFSCVLIAMAKLFPSWWLLTLALLWGGFQELILPRWHISKVYVHDPDSSRAARMTCLVLPMVVIILLCWVGFSILLVPKWKWLAVAGASVATQWLAGFVVGSIAYFLGTDKS
jgi:hypothetical protein